MPKYKVEWTELLYRQEVVEAASERDAVFEAFLLQPRVNEVTGCDLLSEESIEVEEAANDD